MCDYGSGDEVDGWEDQDDHIDFGDEDYEDYEDVSIGEGGPGPLHNQGRCVVSEGCRELPRLTPAQSIRRLPTGASVDLFVSFQPFTVYNAVQVGTVAQWPMDALIGTIDANVRFAASRFLVRHEGETAFGSNPPFHPLGPRPPSIWLQLEGQTADVFGGGYVWIGGEHNILTVFGSLKNPSPPSSQRLRVANLRRSEPETFRCIDTHGRRCIPFRWRTVLGDTSTEAVWLNDVVSGEIVDGQWIKTSGDYGGLHVFLPLYLEGRRLFEPCLGSWPGSSTEIWGNGRCGVVYRGDHWQHFRAQGSRSQLEILEMLVRDSEIEGGGCLEGDLEILAECEHYGYGEPELWAKARRLFEMAPGALRTSPAALSEARHLHAAEPPRLPESSPRPTTLPSSTTPLASAVSRPASETSSPLVQVAGVQDAVSEDFRRFLGTLCLSSKESSLVEAGFAVPLDLKEALDGELQAAGLNMVQIRRVRRFFAPMAVTTDEGVHGNYSNGPIGGWAQGGGGAGGVTTHGNGPGASTVQGGGGSGGDASRSSDLCGGAEQYGVGPGGASTSMAASQAAAAAVLLVEHDQERNQDFGEQSILEAFYFLPKNPSYHPLNNGFDSGRADLSSAAIATFGSPFGGSILADQGGGGPSGVGAHGNGPGGGHAQGGGGSGGGGAHGNGPGGGHAQGGGG